MRRKKKVERALRVTLGRFESGRFITGQRRIAMSGRPTYFCLVGSLEEQLLPSPLESKFFQEQAAFDEALRALGFASVKDASRFNDDLGRKRVIERIKLALEGGCEYAALHRALDESRVEHAKRDLGRKVPNVVPLAWMEQQFTETFAEVEV